MDADYFGTVWDYCYWARDRLLAATEGLSEEEYAKPNGFVYGSIPGILAHTLGGEGAWVARWADGGGGGAAGGRAVAGQPRHAVLLRGAERQVLADAAGARANRLPRAPAPRHGWVVTPGGGSPGATPPKAPG